MKSNEFRIGNYYLSFGVDLKQVETLHKDKILIDFTPIPLTEEWLFKFGFEKLNTMMSGCFVFQKGLWRVAIKVNIEKTYDWVLWHERISPPTWCLSRFKYVHQLQNLYFALTNEELTLKK